MRSNRKFLMNFSPTASREAEEEAEKRAAAFKNAAQDAAQTASDQLKADFSSSTSSSKISYELNISRGKGKILVNFGEILVKNIVEDKDDLSQFKLWDENLVPILSLIKINVPLRSALLKNQHSDWLIKASKMIMFD